MTEVSFHFNVTDRLGYACRLLRKAASSDAMMWVVADPDMADALDSALWALSPSDFVAHCRSNAPSTMVQRSPVVLATTADAPQGRPADVLLNLGDTVPEEFARFSRLLEVVSAGGPDRPSARQRWKHYADRGYPIVRHDVAPSA